MYRESVDYRKNKAQVVVYWIDGRVMTVSLSRDAKGIWVVLGSTLEPSKFAKEIK